MLRVVFFIILYISFCYAQQCSTIRCPSVFGPCNTCTMFRDQVVALTRQICGPYTKAKCNRIFGGAGGLSGDGCNSISCGLNGIVSTKRSCKVYDHKQCIEMHGVAGWACGSSTCFCTPCGIGFINH